MVGRCSQQLLQRSAHSWTHDGHLELMATYCSQVYVFSNRCALLFIGSSKWPQRICALDAKKVRQPSFFTDSLLQTKFMSFSHSFALFRIHLRFLFSFPFLAVLSVLIQRQMADVLVIWGRVDYGGDSSAVQDQLKNVQQTQATRRAFCLCVCVCACVHACVRLRRCVCPSV